MLGVDDRPWCCVKLNREVGGFPIRPVNYIDREARRELWLFVLQQSYKTAARRAAK